MKNFWIYADRYFNKLLDSKNIFVKIIRVPILIVIAALLFFYIIIDYVFKIED